MPALPRLPIDDVLARVVEAVGVGPGVVVEAPPGAGKTTRIPPALMRETGGEIVVLQPRRLATRLAAQRVAAELGERVGQTCGYQMRFDTAVGDATRIRFVTEGVMTQRLRDSRDLESVSVVVLDEFHERHLEADVALALLRRLQADRRADLRIVVMSATLDGEPIADYLGCPRVVSEGRTFPVVIDHADPSGRRPLQAEVAQAVRSLVDDGLDGDVLVFLPGAREIRAATAACETIARLADLEVLPLHGDLSASEQDRAVGPGPRRKVILSTNVAETSITVPGVVAVVDSGLARRPSHNPWSGIPTLQLGKISRASATQRSGRAGRTRPGRCIRLYSQHDYDRRPEHDAPEIERLDLARALIDLHAAGITDPSTLAWLDPPPKASLEAGEELLQRLDAIRSDGTLTACGTEMLRFPLHPRLARFLAEAERLGVAKLGATVAAVLSERPRRRKDEGLHGATADVLAEVEELEQSGIRGQVDRVRRQLGRRVHARAPRPEDPDASICRALLTGYPDRVARVRKDAGNRHTLIFSGGGHADLSPHSVVADAPFVVAIAVEERHDGRTAGRTVVRSAAAIEPEWLLDTWPDRIEEHVRVQFHRERERVEATAELRYEGLVIDASRLQHLPPEATAALRQAALGAGLQAFVDPSAVEQLHGRTAALAQHVDGFPILGAEQITETLARLCEGCSSFAELRKANPVAQALRELDPALRNQLERLAPARVELPSGRSLKVHYRADRAAWVESRLQDFFGMAKGPAIVEGRVPLAIHLLAPNRRAVQVTTDLAGFWAKHYPGIRRTLMRRYPKHAWPEDPLAARPPKSR